MSYGVDPYNSYGDFNSINEAMYWASEWEKQRFMRPNTRWGLEAFRENVPPFFAEDMCTRRCPYDASFCSDINPTAPRGCGPIRRVEMPAVNLEGTARCAGCEGAAGCDRPKLPDLPRIPQTFWDPVPTMASVMGSGDGPSWPVVALIAALALVLGYILRGMSC